METTNTRHRQSADRVAPGGTRADMEAAAIEADRLDQALARAHRDDHTGTFGDLLVDLFDRIEATTGFEAAAREAGFDPELYRDQIDNLPNRRQQKALMAEEYLAHLAEHETRQAGLSEMLAEALQAFIEALRAWLQEMGMHRLARIAERNQDPGQRNLGEVRDLLAGVRAHFGMPEPNRRPPGDHRDRPMDFEAVCTEVDRIIATWPESIRDRVVIFADKHDVPDAIRRRTGTMDTVAGVFDLPSGQIAVMASAMTSPVEIERTLWHEWLHLAMSSPAEPGHPVALHARFYRQITEQMTNREVGLTLGAEGVREYWAVLNEASRDGRQDSVQAMIGRLIAQRFFEADPETLPDGLHRPVGALLREYADLLDAADLPAMAGRYRAHGIHLIEWAETDPGAILDRELAEHMRVRPRAPVPPETTRWRREHETPEATAVAQRAIHDRRAGEMVDPGPVMARRVYHGTPHRFDRFSLEAIGTGEGAQAYGWGLYFAGNRAVAEWYRDALGSMPRLVIDGEEHDSLDGCLPDSGHHRMARVFAAGALKKAGSLEGGREIIERRIVGLSPAMPAEQADAKAAIYRESIETLDALRGRSIEVVRSPGNLYAAQIPDDDALLAWDATLAEQPAGVRETLRPAIERVAAMEQVPPGATGGDLYNRLARADGTRNDRAASEFLGSLGIPGLRYLDFGSRGWRTLKWADDRPTTARDDEVMAIAANYLESHRGNMEAAIDKLYRDAGSLPGANVYGDAAVHLEAGHLLPDWTFNYVIWDDAVVRIEAVNDEMAQAEQAMQDNDTLLDSSPAPGADRDVRWAP